jgi:hypothetical protein
MEGMALIEALAAAFINTFGITQPTEKTRRQAAWFIIGMLVVVVVLLIALGSVLMHFIKS